MSWLERMRSQTVDPSWMPAKMNGGTKNYFDDEALKPLFGGMDYKDREAQLMDETEGVGFADVEDIKKRPELVAAHYLDNPRDV